MSFMHKFNGKVWGSFIVFSFFVFGYFFSKSYQPVSSAHLSSEHQPAYTKESFETYIFEKRRLLQDRTFFNNGSCEKELTDIYDYIGSLKVENFDKENVKAHFSSILKTLFDFRMEVRKVYQDEYFKGHVSKSCAFAHRKLFRGMRVLEDFVGMVGAGTYRKPAAADLLGKKEAEEFYRVFEGNKENFLWNTDYENQNSTKYIPQSGDVLLSRGSATVSAAIARITDEDSNFSHIGLVYVDPVTKKVETIEAHIEYGTLVADISEYRDMKARALVFRFHDPSKTKEENAKIAHEAASKARAEVEKYKKKFGFSKYPSICYDFSMKVDNPINIEPSNDAKSRKCLFCSEVVSLGFSLAGNVKYRVPTFLSPLNPKNRKFIEDIGVTVKETFAPADIELDPYFDLVLEWRDYIRIHKTHRMDAILTSVYSWMDEYGYEFIPPANVKEKTELGYALRRIPVFDKLTGVKDKFPLNLSKNGIAAMQMIDMAASNLYNYLEDLEKRNNKIYTTKEMIAFLSVWRTQDLADYEAIDPEKAYGTKKDPYQSYRVHDFLRAKSH